MFGFAKSGSATARTHVSSSDLSPAQQLNAAELLGEQGWKEPFPGAGRDSGEGRPDLG